jgi:hypothetical protein
MAEPATNLMKSRRRISAPRLRTTPIPADYIRDLRPAKWGSTCKNPEPPMSALGQKQTLDYRQSMFALPPKADISPSIHSINSSAAASSADGAVRPTALSIIAAKCNPVDF